ncbi:MAG TPA: hypothetical protein VHG91_19010 [Longimicrobium sp.]|nr:hypothetical protein [Longimicrobium sp.]
MTHTLRRIALAGLVLAPLFAAASPASAQTPTAEGTVITNTATATWTDANGNTYTPATASVDVTVGFLAGPDVSSPPTVSPASPSTGNELGYTITNSGNGTDSVSVSATASAGVSITGYVFEGTTFTSLTELNTALAGKAIPAGSSITVTVVYTVAPGQGGESIPVSLTATSRRTPATSDASTTNVEPPVAASVNVTPDNGAVSRLPSNGTTYTATYTVQNTGNASDTYTLGAAANPGGALTIVSVNGTAGSSGSVTVAAGGSTTVDVVYSVGDVAAGTTDDLVLTATSGNSAGTSDTGTYTVTVVRAAITMTKEAFRDDQTTAIGASDRVLPGEYIQYRITVTNGGGAAATLTGTGYGISDPLPSEVTYVSTSADAAGWTISESSGTVSATLSGTLAPSASRYFWIRVRIK